MSIQQQAWGAWISPLANQLSKELIIQYEIQTGYGLALYLDVDRVFDNHRAIRIWVQRMLDEGIEKQADHLTALKERFTGCTPIS